MSATITYDKKPWWVGDRRFLAVATHTKTNRRQILVAFYVKEKAELYAAGRTFTSHHDFVVWDLEEKRWPA